MMTLILDLLDGGTDHEMLRSRSNNTILPRVREGPQRTPISFRTGPSDASVFDLAAKAIREGKACIEKARKWDEHTKKVKNYHKAMTEKFGEDWCQ